MRISLRLNPSFLPFRLSPAAWLTLGYLILSSLWILLSDSLAASIAHNDAGTFEKIQAVKGIFFVLLSGIFLYLLSQKLYTGIKISHLQKESILKKYMALNEAAREGIFDYDFRENKATLNNKMKFFYPCPGNEIDNFWQIYKQRIHPDDTAQLENEYLQILKTDKQTWQSEFRLLGTDEKYYRVISNSYLIRNNSTGEPLRLIGAVQDISDLRNLQAEYYEQKLSHKKRLAASIIRAQENERNRWAEELHDNVCQILSVANMYAIDISKYPEHAETLGPELKKLVGESLNEIRQLSANIKTPVFSEESLRESIENLSANINRIKPVSFKLNAKNLDESFLCSGQKLMIYRVVQEQVNNIIKYAEADEVEVRITISNDEAKIAVIDNGKGFDPGKVKTGIGLRNIQSRLQVYGGNMKIISAPGKGCTLHVSFSLSNN